MTEPQVERRIAAILAADMVGFSRLMERDEEAGLDTLNACRSLIQQRVAAHRGRIFGSAGDSVIAEFASAVEAVRSALEIQAAIAGVNAGRPKPVQYRIGVNLGDVMVDDDNLLGDGVNVAARLEALAEPGGVLISGSAFDQVEGKLDHDFELVGRRTLRNLDRAIRIYRWRRREAASRVWTSRLRLPERLRWRAACAGAGAARDRRDRLVGAARAARAAARALPGPVGPAVAGTGFDRGPAVHPLERGSRARPVRGRPGRQHHHRPVALLRAVRGRLELQPS